MIPYDKSGGVVLCLIEADRKRLKIRAKPDLFSFPMNLEAYGKTEITWQNAIKVTYLNNFEAITIQSENGRSWFSIIISRIDFEKDFTFGFTDEDGSDVRLATVKAGSYVQFFLVPASQEENLIYKTILAYSKLQTH